MLKIPFTVNKHLFASEKISREPHLCEYFSSRTGCFMKFCMYEESMFTNIICPSQFITEESRNKVAVNKSRFTVYVLSDLEIFKMTLRDLFHNRLSQRTFVMNINFW